MRRRLGIVLTGLALAAGGAACIPSSPPPPAIAWPAPGDEAAIHVHPFFTCTRQHEVGTADPSGYATNTGNGYYGAYQFEHRTWASVLERAVSGAYLPYAAYTANVAPVPVQDVAAHQLANERGAQPWGGRCREHLNR